MYVVASIVHADRVPSVTGTTAGADTVTAAAFEAELDGVAESVTVRVTTYVPAPAYVQVEVAVLPPDDAAAAIPAVG